MGTQQTTATPGASARNPGRAQNTGRGGPGGGGAGRRRAPREGDEWDQGLIDIARVTRVMAGGKRMRFRATVVIGDRKGRIGWAIAKGTDVSGAIQKAVTKAKKNVITVSILNGTIPHDVTVKFKAARILMKPAKKGKGLIAGGVLRTILDLAGIQNIISKMYGSNNKINNVAATFKALSSLRRVESQLGQGTKKESASDTGAATAVTKVSPAHRPRRGRSDVLPDRGATTSSTEKEP